MKRIILTGGGSAGHVTPNLALVPGLKERGYEIKYIGSLDGIEKQIIEEAGIDYVGVPSGKLRRYFSWKNFTDPFRVQKGYRQAKKIVKQWKPDVVFSKGGFVSVPVVRAAARKKVPVISHESDMTPGLANKLNTSWVKRICCNFPETLNYLPKAKGVLTGCPIRQELLSGSAIAGRVFTGLTEAKPVILFIGGSLGSQHINEVARGVLPQLLEKYQVVHLCGKGNLDEHLTGTPGYVQYEYISDELKDIFAMADMAVSRAGANAICELLALKKPNLLIPLSAAASRGDQILNANSFKKQGFSAVLPEEELTGERLLSEIDAVFENRGQYVEAMEKANQGDAVGTILKMIDDAAEGRL